MKYVPTLLAFFTPLIFCIGCSGDDRFRKAEDAEDAGREFIRASLDGNMKKAEFYLLRDSVNNMLFEKWKTGEYNKLNPEERMSYKQANILPLKIEKENDSTVNYTYSNTYKNKDTTTVKIVRVNGEWLVDFKDIH
ncbi:DUF4878 domain-containing protein [Flavihumibacter fluvii]|uniref:DUF4878 domain-containing protein n=1 Tax=Flavihumibacter fluvii TaxID=2838157 RepID=UPI001BDDD203|nr:DUF4878 domain-containing protein [Flavihumibacter fluvii]ULQ53727.1 DUF4878 domain-containing protein [Flavihumibacter fluvii]